MTPQRLIFITTLVTFMSFFLSPGNAKVLSDNVVVDDYQANPKDFQVSEDPATKSEAETKPTIIAACDEQTCKSHD